MYNIEEKMPQNHSLRKVHRTLFDWFSNVANRKTNKTALIFKSQSITFSETKNIIENISQLMQMHNFRKKPIIVACFENGFAMPLIALAASKLGATIIPISPTLRKEHIKKILKIAQPNFVLSSLKSNKNLKEAVEHYQNIRMVHFIYKSSTDLYNPDIFILNESKSQNSINTICKTLNTTFIMNFTSGSTGNPKPVLISEESKINRLELGTIKLFNLREEDRILITTPQYHSLGFRQSLLPLVLGGVGVILDKFNPQSWVETAETNKITFCISVSTQLAQIADTMTNDNKKLCPSIKKIVSSSAPLDIDTRNKCLNHFACEIFETYGLSETGFVTLKKLKKDNEQNNSIGKPLPFVSVKLFDAHKNNFTHETNTTGEIAVKCSSIFDGYGNDLNEHPKYIFKDYFLTGDLAYLDEKGELTFVGRTQEVIQNSGINVYPLDVEKMVKQYPSVKDACVFGVPEGGSSEKIVLLYSTSFEIDENDLIRFLLKNLTDWQMPKYFRRVSEIDLSPVGKVDRKNMRDKFLRKTLGVM